MIRILLLDNKTGQTISYINSPVIPPTDTTLRLAPSGKQPSRDFYVMDILDMIFSEDGPRAGLALSHVTMAVAETLESRQRRAERAGRTDP